MRHRWRFAGRVVGGDDLVVATLPLYGREFHRYPDGIDLSELPLDSLADVDAIVGDAATEDRAIGVEAFAGRDVTGRAVLVRTGWQRRWRTPTYPSGHPFLTAAAEHLVEAGTVLVGIDSLNIDDTPEHGERPAHTTRLGVGIPICAHLADPGPLSAGGMAGFRLSAAATDQPTGIAFACARLCSGRA
jgi:kynurenine formamidase